MLRPTKIRQYISFMEEKGFAPVETLRGSGIRKEQLNDPSYLLDRGKCETVIANMIRLTGNQAIGFEVGRQAKLADFGVVALAMRSSRTLGEAIEYWIRYSNLVGMLIHHTAVEGPRQEWTVFFTATQPLGFLYNFCVEEILMTGIRLGSELVGTQLQIREVTLSYPAPLHARLYQQNLGCPVHFNSPRSGIRVKGPPLSTVLPGYDKELNEVYRRHCREVLRLIRSDDPFVARVQSLLMNSPGGLPDLPAAARRLGVSARTLRRNLAAEGSSFQELVNRYRMEACIDYLRSGLAAKEIATLLGFVDTNSLRRAFKSWTGETLGSRQAQAAAGRPLTLRTVPATRRTRTR
jgi:AraC-like DNA-binding protein